MPKGFKQSLSLFAWSVVFFAFISVLSPKQICAQENTQEEHTRVFRAAQADQKNQKWLESLAKFRKIIAASAKSELAQKARIEVGKYHKYNRDWEMAINEYHKAIAANPHSRPAHDAKTAEAAVYYFRQDFPRAVGIFKEVLAETKDWDQIKYCSYWLKELRRKMSFSQSQSFSCGPEALRIACNILGIKTDKKELAGLFNTQSKEVSLSELTKVALEKGLKPKVVKICKNEIQNLDTPFIASVNPEHYVVVTDIRKNKVKYIDPANQQDDQTETLDKFNANFRGYALIFQDQKEFTLASNQEARQVKGGVCYCCPPSALGGAGSNPNVEFDGAGPSCPGMPSWLVNTVNLNLIIQDIDFAYTSRGMPVEFIRTWNGDDPRDGIFGHSWTFNYNITLLENPDRSIDIRRGDGKVDHFIWNGTRFQGPESIYDALTKNINGTYALKLKADKSTQNFDTQGRLVNIKSRNNQVISFSYDLEGKLTKITDPNGKNTVLSYGANNKVSRLSLPDGRYVTFLYDVSNNLIQSSDMVRATSSLTYNAAGYVTSIFTPHQGTATFEYNVSGEGYAIKTITDVQGNKRSYGTYLTHYQIRVTDSRGNATLYANNYEGYTLSVVAASGNKITFEYSDLGNRVKIMDALGNATLLTYDLAGNVLSVTSPLASKAAFIYDANSNLLRATDPKGNISTFTYDSNNNLILVKNQDNQATSLAYNGYGQLTRITDPKSGVIDFAYDVSGNLIKQTNPLGKIDTYTYDTLGRAISSTDSKGNKFSYAYDGVDHLTKITYPDAATVNYTYNCCNLTQLQDKNGTLKFSYDNLGRTASFTNYDNKVISYAYDSEGNLTTLTYPDSKKVNYAYDMDNRLVKVTDWLGNATSYNYDLRGNLSFSASPGLLTVNKYDVEGRMNKLINYNASTMAISSGFEYSLDALSNRTKIKRYLPLNIPSFSAANSSYTYNSDNQLTASTGKTFAYDANGNLTKQTAGTAITNFTYDLDNQLTQYILGSTNLAYQYDAFGNRVKKTSGTTITKYIVDPQMALPSVIAETDSFGTITAYYVYGLGLISKIVGTSAYFYQYDGIGSTVAITDKTGVVKNKYAYDDFGNLATNSTETVISPFKYVGKYGVQTDAPDLLYMRARYYSPSIGRFINKDPIGLAGGMNLYNYVDSNPINQIDPSGEIAIADDIIYYFIASYAVYYIYQNYIVNNSGVCYFSRSKKGPLWNAPGMPGDNIRRYNQNQPGEFKPPPNFRNWKEKVIWAAGLLAKLFKNLHGTE